MGKYIDKALEYFGKVIILRLLPEVVAKYLEKVGEHAR